MAFLSALTFFAVGIPDVAKATSATWVGTAASSSWTTGANWNPTTAPGGASSDVATFLTAPNAVTSVAIDSGRNVGAIIFTTNAGSFNFTTNQPLITDLGSIQMTSGLLGTGITETFSAGFIVGGNSPGSPHGISVTNDSADSTNTFNITGNVGADSNGSSKIDTLTLGGANTGNNTISGVVNDGVKSGRLALTKTGNGTWILSGSNSYTGVTTVDGGILNLASNSALGATSSVTVNSGGTLLLSNAVATNRVPNGATFVLAGGKIQQAATGISETMGALTLNANSTLAFAGGSGDMVFSSFNWTAGTLAITGWNGTGATPGTASNTRLLFAANPGAGNLSHFTINGSNAVMFVANGGFTELVLVPEASTIFAGLAFLGLIGWRERRRVSSVFRMVANRG